ncbi:MAG TPA: TonB-dependent receptor [Thermoanaerobaculia bacterium]|nr:TonB-dependent receptor [Thermoanaerobaculia bacterium]
MSDHQHRLARRAMRSSCRANLVALAVAAVSLLLPVAGLAGEVRGRVLGPGDAPLPGVTVSLANDLTGYSQQVVSGNDGTYILYNVPNNPYHLRASLEGFKEAHLDVDVRGSVPVARDLHLSASFSETTTVTAEKENVALETDESTTHTDIDKSLIQRFPAAVASRAFEAIVTSAPGFSKDENGRYHFQGGHSQQLLVIDGQSIGDQVGITFSNSLNPAIAQGIEIVTGGVPAEYGEKAYGVINLTTRSALGQNGLRGDASAGAGSFSTYEGDVGVGYGGKQTGAFLNLDASRSDRFLDPVTFDNFHNHGDTLRGFFRYDLLPGQGQDSFRFTANGGRTQRDVTNLPSQEAAGQDERVHSRDWNLNAGYLHVFGSDTVAEGQVYARDNRLQLLGSPNDTPVLATQNRKLDNQGLNASMSKNLGDNEIKVGIQAKRFPITEHFSFLITDPTLNDPASDGYNPNLAPYDGTRGGSPFVFDGSRTGRYLAGYAQDTVKWHNLTVNAGLRYDSNHLFLSESQLQPRIGAAYYIPQTATVVRASYDKMFITPEYENILLSSSAQASSLSPPDVQQSAIDGFGHLFNRSEHHNAINAGIQQGIGSKLRVDVSYWKRQVQYTADQDQFFNTGIVFPLNFKGGDLSGWNVRLDGGPYAGLRAYLSLGHVHALYDPPLVGGLFINGSPADFTQGGPFLIDHDQKLQEQLGIFWDIPKTGFWTGVTQRYDSGLVTDAGAPADVLGGGPDTAYAEPYINFNSTPERIKSRTVWDFSVGARLAQYGLPFELQLDVLNAFDKQGLYNFMSTFGGTHVIPPRIIAGRVRYLF